MEWIIYLSGFNEKESIERWILLGRYVYRDSEKYVRLF